MTAEATWTTRTNYLFNLVQSGLTLQHALVLSYLVEAVEETGMLAEGDITVGLSRYDIQERTGLSSCQVQRALAALVAAECIVRDQPVKKSGMTARTLLTAKALRLMASESADVLKHDVPADVAALLIGEEIDCIRAVSDAWAAASPYPAEIEDRFRGGTHKLSQIRALLFERHAARQEAILGAVEATDARRAADEKGEHTLTLPDATTVTLSRDHFRKAAGDNLAKLVDMRFVRDTLERLVEKCPRLVTRRSLPRLVADIAYSRVSGFVMAKDAAHAIRILTACIQKATWTKPRSMDNRWYTAGEAAIC